MLGGRSPKCRLSRSTDMIDTAAVLAVTDLAALIGETVRLKKQGQQLYGLCPYHADRTPTLRVDPKKGLWYCPSCQLGGDAFRWLQQRDGIGFREAATDLAARAGLDHGANAQKQPRDAPRLAPVPKEPRYPEPIQRPILPWGGQHLMKYGLPVLILNEFPGRRNFFRMAEMTEAVWGPHDIVWFPSLWDGIGYKGSGTPSAGEMDLAPIYRAAVKIAPGRDLWEQRRARELERLIWRARGYAIMADSRRAGEA